MKINRTTPETQKYLQIIATIAKKPKALYVLGALPEVRMPSVAIVGTRKPTAYGREVTHTLAYDLAQKKALLL